MLTTKVKRVGWIDPDSEVFAKLFPEFADGVLCRKLTPTRRLERATNKIEAMARLVSRSMDFGGDIWKEEITERFIRRICHETFVAKYDPTKGTMEEWLLGAMRNIVKECRREWLRRRIETRNEMPQVADGRAGLGEVAERRDMVEHVRKCLMTFSARERNAVARGFEALSDLDSGGYIANEAVVRHRALASLRRKLIGSPLGLDGG